MACINPYTQLINGCANSITITSDMGLEGETEYMFLYTFKSGNKIAIGYETDIDGEIVITQNDDVDGFWSYADELVTFQIFLGNACAPHIATICDVEYDTFGFEFMANYATESALYPCEC